MLRLFSAEEKQFKFEEPTSTIMIVDGTMLPFTFEKMVETQMATESVNTLDPLRAINLNSNGSRDFGKYQINDRSWLYPRNIDPYKFIEDEGMQDEMFKTIITTHAKIMMDKGHEPTLKNVKKSMGGIGYFLATTIPTKPKKK
jgi:hypothetical protein